MHGQVLLRNVTRDWHRIEYVHEKVIHFSVEALHYLVAEGERLSHVARLVVASEQHHVLGEVELYSKEQHADFDTEDATVYVVSQEEVVETAWLACF